jgi:FixJ family two-component response regulator
MSQENPNPNPNIREKLSQTIEKGKVVAHNILDNLSNVETYNKLGNSAKEIFQSIVEKNHSDDIREKFEIIQRKIEYHRQILAREREILANLERQEAFLKTQIL